MPIQVVAGAQMMCPMGTNPAMLIVTSNTTVMVGNKPAATIVDMVPITNIPTFGPCKSPTFPATASATAAALGVLTPMPCVPLTGTPWTPGCSTVTINFIPALNNTSTCSCKWGGVIAITDPGQTTVMIP